MLYCPMRNLKCIISLHILGDVEPSLESNFTLTHNFQELFIDNKRRTQTKYLFIGFKNFNLRFNGASESTIARAGS